MIVQLTHTHTHTHTHMYFSGFFNPERAIKEHSRVDKFKSWEELRKRMPMPSNSTVHVIVWLRLKPAQTDSQSVNGRKVNFAYTT